MVISDKTVRRHSKRSRTVIPFASLCEVLERVNFDELLPIKQIVLNILTKIIAHRVSFVKFAILKFSTHILK